jgi:hypothetical protein
VTPAKVVVGGLSAAVGRRGGGGGISLVIGVVSAVS